MTGPEILVVDDDDLHRELVADYLTLGGFAVRQAADGREALAAMRRTPPAVVVLDVQMPELDGVGVIDEMRRSPALAAIPVVFLSGVTSPHVRIRALELGADDFVAKPTHPAELLARVRAVLRRRAAAPPPAIALAGTLGGDGVTLDEVLQTLLATRRSSRLALPHLGASVTCVGGVIVDAGWRTHRGQPALERIALAARGGFVVEVAPPAAGPDDGGLSLLAALVAIDHSRGALGDHADATVALATASATPPSAALARRAALFPLTVADLLVSLDGDLATATAAVVAALAAGHLIPLSSRSEVT